MASILLFSWETPGWSEPQKPAPNRLRLLAALPSHPGETDTHAVKGAPVELGFSSSHGGNEQYNELISGAGEPSCETDCHGGRAYQPAKS